MYARLILALAWLAAALMVAAGFMLTWEVIARYFFTKPTIWAAELSQMCLIWGCMLAMAQVLAARQHIAVNAVTSLLSAGACRIVEYFVLVCVLAFSLVVSLYGWEIFYDSFERGRTTGSLMNLPVWIVELAVPVGFVLLSIQCVVEIARLVGGTELRTGSAHE